MNWVLLGAALVLIAVSCRAFSAASSIPPGMTDWAAKEKPRRQRDLRTRRLTRRG